MLKNLRDEDSRERGTVRKYEPVAQACGARQAIRNLNLVAPACGAGQVIRTLI